MEVSFTIFPWSVLNKQHGAVEDGGIYKPPNCVARQKVAIIIPYSNREKHLKVMMNNLHPFLQRQQAHYRIFVIDMVS